MKLTLINKGAGASRLILIAAGWSTTAEFYEGIGMPGWDTAVVTQDGTDDNASDIVAEIEDRYKTVYLYAWSLGVAMSEKLCNAGLRTTAAFAIAGTPMPCSDSEGIPTAVFRATRDTLDARNLFKFRCRICGGASAYRRVADKFERAGNNEVALLRKELEIAERRTYFSSVNWTKAFVCTEDAIFPPASQNAYWRSRGVPVKELKSHHYVDIQEIVDSTIVNLPRAGRRFARSSSSYNDHAVAQREIARRLAELTADKFCGDSVKNVLELGCGSGELSRALSDLLHIVSATFVDLYSCGHFGVADSENYLTGDAELLVEEMQSGSFDLICSSSAIQWFSDTARFLRNCQRLISEDGLVALSTFAEGNLSELDSLRDSSIGYLSKDKLYEIAKSLFEDVEIETDEIKLAFVSPSELMRHLRLTGVTASATKSMSPAELRDFMRHLPADDSGHYTLTFRPVYILARHPRVSLRNFY